MKFSKWKATFKWESLAPSDLSHPSTLVRILVSKLNMESEWTNSVTLKNPLFIWRCICSFICTFVLFTYLFFLLPRVGGQFFLPYTNINFILLTIYFVTAVVFSLREYKFQKNSDINMGTRMGINSDGPLENELGDFLADDGDIGWTQPKRFYLTVPMKIFWVYFELCFTNALFLDLVFWTLLFPAEQNWSDPFNYFVHLVNFILIFVELLLNSLTFIPAHFIFVVLFLLCYMVLSFSWYVCILFILYYFYFYTRKTQKDKIILSIFLYILQKVNARSFFNISQSRPRTLQPIHILIDHL